MDRAEKCPCCDTPWAFSIEEPVTPDIVQADDPSGEMIWYLTSGQFTSTVKTSQNISSIDKGFIGGQFFVYWDGRDTCLNDINHSSLIRTSGQFTTTVRDSEQVLVDSIFNPDDVADGMITAGGNTVWTKIESLDPAKRVVQSGKFTSTIKDSFDTSTIKTPGADRHSLDDAGNFCFQLYTTQTVVKGSGLFSTTVKTSLDLSQQVATLNLNEFNTFTLNNVDLPRKLRRWSGQFTTTVQASGQTVANGQPIRDFHNTEVDYG